jgi:hypothetical protein
MRGQESATTFTFNKTCRKNRAKMRGFPKGKGNAGKASAHTESGKNAKGTQAGT